MQELLLRGPEQDANRYMAQKTLVQGALDVGVLVRSCKMLKEYIECPLSTINQVQIGLCILTILLAIASGLVFIIMGLWNWNDDQKKPRLNQLNNASLILVFLIVICEIILAVFDSPGTEYKKMLMDF